jgi:transcriptional regulator with XRE-family HTH domain
MDEVRLGRSLRALRRRRGLTQAQLGAAAGFSREVVSRLERGDAGSIRIDMLVGAAAVLGARVDVHLRWQGERLDRLLDAAHAALVGRAVEVLAAAGWEARVEVTFSRYGERGSIDVLARHEPTATVPDLQGMLASLDRKARLAAWVADQLDWGDVATIGRLLVLPDQRTSYRRLAEHRSILTAALPDRGWSVRRWIRSPGAPGERPLAGILLLPDPRLERTRLVRAPRDRRGSHPVLPDASRT